MSLEKLDAILAQVVELIYRSVPFQEWREVRYVARLPPDLSAGAWQFFFTFPDGTARPDAPAVDASVRWKIHDLLVEHRRLTEAMGQPWWFEIDITIERDGRFRTQFGYRDNYSEAEFMGPILPR